MTIAWTPANVARLTAGLEPAYVGRHRASKRPRPVAPLAPRRPLDAVELECEGLFVVLRHLGDGRTTDDAWSLARIDTLDLITAQACAA